MASSCMPDFIQSPCCSLQHPVLRRNTSKHKRSMHSIMIRTYDPDIDEWRFQWMNEGYPHLIEQIRGRFENGVGMFYGSETSADKLFKLRFR